MIEEICKKDIELLQEADIVFTDQKFKCTAHGDAMARYYVKFETMKTLLTLPPRAKISEIVWILYISNNAFAV